MSLNGYSRDSGFFASVPAVMMFAPRRKQPSNRAWPGRALVVAAGLLPALAAAGSPAGQGPVRYNRDIRPLMTNTCFKCHGPDVRNNPSDLRLDLPEMAFAPRRDKTGRVSTPIVPGRPEASEVWRRITSTDPTVEMPPPDAPQRLSPQDQALIRRWIEQGAKYEKHWAYVLPRKAPLPAVRETGAVRNPIDRFIVAALEERGLTPSPEADRQSLIRRVSLDLIGLPPTPGETERFLEDRAPGAYERVVDRLLASPHYGERMAVPWLDLARFADSVGYHGDQLLNDFPYREYVIGAFNRNLPFDRFTLEQLAGDLLPHPTVEQRVASGFNRLNMVSREGGAQPKEYLAKYAADRVRTVSTTWLGSTMACCECHDHKFDPFKTRDFYAMEAYFADVQQWGVYKSNTYTPEPELARLIPDNGNDSPFPPEMPVRSPYLVARMQRFRGRLEARGTAAAQAMLRAPGGWEAVRRWTEQVAARLPADAGGCAIAPVERAALDAELTSLLRPDGSIVFEQRDPAAFDRAVAQAALLGDDRKFSRAALTLRAPPGPMAALRIEVLPDPAHGGTVTTGGIDAFALKNVSLCLLRRGADAPRPLAFAAAYADRQTDDYFNGRLRTSLVPPADCRDPSLLQDTHQFGHLDGWTSAGRFVRQAQAALYLLSQPVELAAGDRLVLTLSVSGVGRMRLAASPLGCRLPGETLSPAEREAFLAPQPTPAQEELLAAEYFRGTGRPQAFSYPAALAELREIADCRDGWTDTVVTVSVPPRVTRVLPRGDWQNETGEIVQPAPPAFLAGASDGRPQTRLDLARWLTSRQNPLTARAFVNRLWRQFFGAGLSLYVDDLGTHGEYPSNPELLDWLAVDFRDHGWNVKRLVRLIVTSGTYRQSSRRRAELDAADPANRLLGRQNPRRLDAEFVRDNALYAAGLLNLDIGGPSAFPYQPPGYYSALEFPVRRYVAETDDRQYRRGVYVHWQRTFLHPMLANFDAPSREECTAERVESSTPQQALTLLDDPTFVEAARGLAEEALRPADADFTARLADAYRRLLARSPKPAESRSLEGFYRTQLAYYRSHPEDAAKLAAVGQHPAPPGLDRPELAAWTAVTRVLLNLNETIVRY